MCYNVIALVKRDKMAHIVFCDDKSHELDKILDGSKTMLIRGAEGRKVPHSRVFESDELYFIEKGSNAITAKAIVSDVSNYVKLYDEEITKIIDDNSDKLCLSDKQIQKAHKRCLCLVEFKDVEKIDTIATKPQRSLDDWLIVDDLDEIKLEK